MTLTRDDPCRTYINGTRQSAPLVAFLQSELSPQPPDMSRLSDREKGQLHAAASAAHRQRDAVKTDAPRVQPAATSPR